jgi:hypothetical protein
LGFCTDFLTETKGNIRVLIFWSYTMSFELTDALYDQLKNMTFELNTQSKTDLTTHQYDQFATTLLMEFINLGNPMSKVIYNTTNDIQSGLLVFCYCQ